MPSSPMAGRGWPALHTTDAIFYIAVAFLHLKWTRLLESWPGWGKNRVKVGDYPKLASSTYQSVRGRSEAILLPELAGFLGARSSAGRNATSAIEC